MRAKGGFGLVMTCAAHVQRIGQGFPGQLGVFGDEHLPGLTRLAARDQGHGAVASVQLHHAGIALAEGTDRRGAGRAVGGRRDRDPRALRRARSSS